MTCLLLELFVCFHLNCSVAIDQLCRAHHDEVSWKMGTLALNIIIIIIEWSSFFSSSSSSSCISQKDLGDHTPSSLPLHCNGDLPSSCAKRATLSLYSRSCTAIYYYTATTLLLLYYYTTTLFNCLALYCIYLLEFRNSYCKECVWNKVFCSFLYFFYLR